MREREKVQTVTPRCLGMWRLDSVVKGGRTVQEMVVVVNIYIYIFTRGYKTPTQCPQNKQTKTFRPYRPELKCVAPWAPAGPIRPKYWHPLKAQARPQLGPGTKPEAKYFASHSETKY